MEITRRRMHRIYDELLPFSPSDAVSSDTLLQLSSGWDVSLPGYILANMVLDTNEAVVIDPFVGAGATLLACGQEGQECVGSDIDPLAVVASYAKTGNRSRGEIFEAIANVRNLVTSDLTLKPEAWRLSQSLWTNCVVTTIACNWMLRAWSPNSFERRYSAQHLWSSVCGVGGSPRVLWGDVRSSELWQVITSLTRDRPWLIITSPPFAESRGTFGRCAAWLRSLAADLAMQVTGLAADHPIRDQSMTGEGTCLKGAWHSILLAKVAAHCCTRAVVIAEYEVLRDDWSWLDSLTQQAAIDSWDSIVLQPLYDASPDGRDYVTEGGLLIAER